MKYSKIKKAIDASCRADVETILECSNGEGLLESILSAGEEDDIDTACKLLNSKDGEEILVAALDLSIQISDIDECYQGEWSSDRDFAQDMAESLGDIDRGASWPHTCIDWGQAASDLMMDYGESNHHYFRNM